MELLQLPIPRLPPAGQHQSWGGLHGASLALAACEAGAAADRLCLLITGTPAEAEILARDLRFFTAAHADLPVLHFPDRETLPYDNFSPHQDIVSDRLLALYQLPSTRRGILVAPITTLMQRLPPREYVWGHSLALEQGQQIDPAGLVRQLEQAGYHRVETVCEHGEFAVRGSLLDVFPMGSEQPFRIDLFDDEIENLRSFDPDTQRTIDKLQRIQLLAAREVPNSKPALRLFRDQWSQYFDINPRDCPLYQDVIDGISPAGIEYYLPLFFERTDLLTGYLPAEALVLAAGDIHGAASRYWAEIADRYGDRNIDPRRPLLPPAAVFAPVEELFASLKALPRVNLSISSEDCKVDFDTRALPELQADHRATRPWARFEEFLGESGGRTLICAETSGRREALLEQLARASIRPQVVEGWAGFLAAKDPVCLAVAPLDAGFEAPVQRYSLVTEAQLLGARIAQRRSREAATTDAEAVIRNLAELRLGAPVVHIDHGVGRYRGLETLTIDGEPTEFLSLEYADDAKLYVPITSLRLISRYSGAEDEAAPLHRLGSDQWQKLREKVARDVRDTAAELLAVYAKRAAMPGRSITVDEESYRRFCADFPFEETPDQQAAIDAVIADLAAPHPMDRLVCGDVGFGKTEVAMRAAFVAVQNSRQVAILVPTTLLAQQHYESLCDRFADWPVRVEVLSRMVNRKHQDDVMAAIAAGRVDIVVATHKLLQEDFRFHDLGLLVIDEEHRFGVRHKERLKALRSEIDILTLTATPIPRTLNMAMGGMRDLSIIATPPARRLSVKTFVRGYDVALIKEAVLREILRGGQVFYLHNEVKSIDRKARELEQLVPEARVAVAHGQMREQLLESTMSDFYHKRFNLLVCTTIIETGIDIPSANTIVIERADKFGLAQLHQLRGRVGRSHHQAYAYLLTPDPRAMTPDAGKRLEAIAETSELGAGFTLATHDLEIRGAGELLGEEQSGNISGVGFALYMDMLQRAVNAIRNGETFDMSAAAPGGAEVNLNIPALIPATYLPDIQLRLSLYKRLSEAADEDQLLELRVELVDRFGPLPPEAANLLRVMALKMRAESLGIGKLDGNKAGLALEFAAHTRVDPLTLVRLVQEEPKRYKLTSGNRLHQVAELKTAQSRLDAASAMMDLLSAPRD